MASLGSCIKKFPFIGLNPRSEIWKKHPDNCLLPEFYRLGVEGFDEGIIMAAPFSRHASDNAFFICSKFSLKHLATGSGYPTFYPVSIFGFSTKYHNFHSIL